mmetsp:Transcript_17592/g.36439  ORF Transcript_17592/g.36439 Transcript_17592/m.36439 type:complete len:296 (+) Transcript_17592:246-1133(+)
MLGGVDAGVDPHPPEPGVEVNRVVQEGIGGRDPEEGGGKAGEDLVGGKVGRCKRVVLSNSAALWHVLVGNHLNESRGEDRVPRAHDPARAHTVAHVQRWATEHKAVREGHGAPLTGPGVVPRAGSVEEVLGAALPLDHDLSLVDYLVPLLFYINYTVVAELDRKRCCEVPPGRLSSDSDPPSPESQHVLGPPIAERLISIRDLVERDRKVVLWEKVVLRYHDDAIGRGGPLAEEGNVGRCGVDEPTAACYVEYHVVDLKVIAAAGFEVGAGLLCNIAEVPIFPVLLSPPPLDRSL